MSSKRDQEVGKDGYDRMSILTDLTPDLTPDHMCFRSGHLSSCLYTQSVGYVSPCPSCESVLLSQAPLDAASKGCRDSDHQIWC